MPTTSPYPGGGGQQCRPEGQRWPGPRRSRPGRAWGPGWQAGGGRRVSVGGVPGAGKSTVGRELARRLGSRFVELDSIHHQPGWTPLPREPFRARVAEELEADTWVVDGNYSAVQEDRKSTRLNSSH